MSVALLNGVERSEGDVAACERLLGISLPSDYRRFVLTQDGARAAGNIFAVGADNDCSVNRFIPMADIHNETAFIENLPATRVPIAWAEGGNYVCLETAATGGVFFWDHEEPAVEYRIADNFENFLTGLMPFSADDGDSDTSTVKRAWIDPDFLERVTKR